MDLRPYQVKVINDLYGKINQGAKSILLYAPTGAGKTIIVSMVIKHAVGRGRSVLFLVHREELVKQSIAALKKFEVEAGIIKAGWESNSALRVQIASVQTLNRRANAIEKLDIVIIDECHTTSYYRSCKEILTGHTGIIIGVTATPWRTKKNEGLDEYYEDIVKAPLPKSLIEQGYLVPPIYYAYPYIDLTNVRTKAGEYDSGDLEVAVNTPKVNQHVVDEYKRLANGRRSIAFTVSVNHAKSLTETFIKNGISSESIEANTISSDRDIIFRNSELGVISNISSVGVLTEGFDATWISCILMVRPTQSRALNFQMIGRGLRICEDINKEDCIVLDFSRNYERHGIVQEIEDIEMDSPNHAKGQSPTKTCPECFKLLSLGVEECPECGFKFDLKKDKKKAKEILDALVRVMPKEERAKLKQYQRLAKTAYKKSHHPLWAAVKYKEKYSCWPPKDYKYGAIFGSCPTSSEKNDYQNYLSKIVSRKAQSVKPITEPSLFIEANMKYEFGEDLILKRDKGPYVENKF